MIEILTSQQAAFVASFVAGSGNGTRAAVEAGYSPASARQAAYRLLRLSHIQDAISREQGRLLRSVLATKALGVLERVLDDEKAPPGVRVDAAKTVLDRAGHVALRVAEFDSGRDKPLSQLSLAELEEMAGALEAGIRVLEGARDLDDGDQPRQLMAG